MVEPCTWVYFMYVIISLKQMLKRENAGLKNMYILQIHAYCQSSEIYFRETCEEESELFFLNQ